MRSRCGSEPVLRDAAESVVIGFDRTCRPPATFGLGEFGETGDLGEARVVDLQQESRLDESLILDPITSPTAKKVLLLRGGITR